MRFDKETRAKIQEKAPNSVTIKWPTGAAEPQKGRVYWLQSLEEVERNKERLNYSPPSHSDVMARMHLHFYGEWPEGYEPPRRKEARRKPDDVLLVLDTTILDRGWEATVVLYEPVDPVRHLRGAGKVAGGPHPIDKEWGSVATELEPEQIITPQTRREREDEEDALRIEHQASVDLAKAQKQVAEQTRKGKPGKLAAAALERAQRRARSFSVDSAA